MARHGRLNSGWKGSTYVINVRSGVKWTNGTALTGADVAYSINLARQNADRPVLGQRRDGRERHRQREHGHGHVQGHAGLHRVHRLPVAGAGPSRGRLVQAPRQPDRDLRQHAPGRHRPDDAGHLQRPGGRVPDPAELVGHQRARPELQVQVPGRRRQRLQRPGTRPADRGQHRLVEQLPARHQPADAAVGGNSGYTLKTFYSTTPYMLSANTVWLEPNDSVAPMSNVNFRKAMAYALNPAAIAQTVYGGIAAPANPTGLLPGLSSFVNQSVVSADAPTYNPAKAKQYLAHPATTASPSPCRCQTAGRTGWTPPPSSRTNSRRSASTSTSSSRRPTRAPRTWTRATTTCSLTTTPALTPRRGATTSGCTRCRSPRTRTPSSTGSGSTRRPTGRWCSRRPPSR